MRRLPVLALGLVASVMIANAADISGIWLGSVTGGRRNRLFRFAPYLDLFDDVDAADDDAVFAPPPQHGDSE